VSLGQPKRPKRTPTRQTDILGFDRIQKLGRSPSSPTSQTYRGDYIPRNTALWLGSGGVGENPRWFYGHLQENQHQHPGDFKTWLRSARKDPGPFSCIGSRSTRRGRETARHELLLRATPSQGCWRSKLRAMNTCEFD
jgi:hypothetical protein